MNELSAPRHATALSPRGPLAGTRERRRAATREAISRAAYDLIRTEGPASLTAESVAHAAGVSRRTFFNYFPTVESALEPTARVFFDAFGARLREAPDDEHVLDWLARRIEHPQRPEMVEMLIVLARANEQSPQARRIIREVLGAWLGWFEEIIRERMERSGEPVDELEVTMLAGAMVGLAEAATRVWLRQTGGEITPETILEHRALLARGIRLIATGFRGPTD